MIDIGDWNRLFSGFEPAIAVSFTGTGIFQESHSGSRATSIQSHFKLRGFTKYSWLPCLWFIGGGIVGALIKGTVGAIIGSAIGATMIYGIVWVGWRYIRLRDYYKTRNKSVPPDKSVVPNDEIDPVIEK